MAGGGGGGGGGRGGGGGGGGGGGVKNSGCENKCGFPVSHFWHLTSAL